MCLLSVYEFGVDSVCDCVTRQLRGFTTISFYLMELIFNQTEGLSLCEFLYFEDFCLGKQTRKQQMNK